VIAYVVGVGLILLVCVGVPLKYAGGTDTVVAAIGPIHGVLYMVYLACAYDLASRCRLPLRQTILIMLAGTIPFLSFVAERRVSALIRRKHLAAPAGARTARPAAGETAEAPAR
jgi:integral membrane protein